MADVMKWTLNGDWFDTCKCSIPCPCNFAQPPTTGDCEGILAWHFRSGRYGEVPLDGLNVMAVGAFTGNLWVTLRRGPRTRPGSSSRPTRA